MSLCYSASLTPLCSLPLGYTPSPLLLLISPPLPPISPGYTIPGGSDWGGLNDRLGVGPRSISLPALKRLSVVRALVEQGGYHSLNAERVYLAQMAFLKVKVGGGERGGGGERRE